MLRLIAITTFSINLRFKAKQSKANVILQIRSVWIAFKTHRNLRNGMNNLFRLND